MHHFFRIVAIPCPDLIATPVEPDPNLIESDAHFVNPIHRRLPSDPTQIVVSTVAQSARSTSAWFQRLAEAPLTQRPSLTTVRFLQEYPRISLTHMIRAGALERMERFSEAPPSREDIISTIPYEQLLVRPELSLLDLPKNPTLNEIVEATSQKYLDLESTKQRLSTLQNQISSVQYEMQKKYSAALWNQYHNYTETYTHLSRQTNQDDMESIRYLNSIVSMTVSDAVRAAMNAYESRRIDAEDENRYHAFKDQVRLRADVAEMALTILQPNFAGSRILRSGGEISGKPTPIPTAAPVNAIPSLEEALMASLHDRMDRIMTYVRIQIEKYRCPSLGDHVTDSTPFTRIITHTLPALMATGDLFGLFNGPLEAAPHDDVTHRRESALAIISLLVDPALLTSADKNLLKNELPMLSSSPTIDAIIRRHSLFPDSNENAHDTEAWWI